MNEQMKDYVKRVWVEKFEIPLSDMEEEYLFTKLETTQDITIIMLTRALELAVKDVG